MVGITAHCNSCNAEVRRLESGEFSGYCMNCNWVRTHLSIDPSRCSTCLNNLGKTKKGQIICASLMFQLQDGTWKDRYGQANHSYLEDMGRRRRIVPVEPTKMMEQWECDCYEDNKGLTREEFVKRYPLYFYRKDRHF